MSKYDDVKLEIEKTGGRIGSQLPNANWCYVEGNMTPAQLRTIATKIEKGFKKK